MSFINVGYDASGNGNNWTSNNIDYETTSTGTDIFVDTPTPSGTDTGAGGEVRGNYATLNPLARMLGTVGTSNISTISNGNLTVVPSANNNACQATFGLSSGKWYWEVNVVTGTISNNVIVGISYNGSYSLFDYGVGYEAGGNKSVNGSSSSYGSSTTTGNVIGVALDVDASTVTFYKDNASQGSISYTATSLPVFPAYWAGGGVSANHVFNFGQRPFEFAAPSGFAALCTTNLPEPTIADGSYHFDVVTWTDDATGNKVITAPNFSLDMIWSKSRSNATDHAISDRVRGNYQLFSNATYAEDTTQRVTFGTGNVTLNDGYGVVNETGASGYTYVEWLWKANGSGVSNTDGSITSTVSANTTSGFSIVTYTGTGSAGTVGHGLGVAPEMIILKNRDRSAYWSVYTKTTGINGFLRLNTSDPSVSSSGLWGSAAPTSTVFGISGTDYSNGYVAGEKIVAYCFAPVEGFSAFGSYTGNGSNDGPFVYCGFRPKFLIVKRTDTTANWYLYDSVRTSENQTNFAYLNPNTSGVEDYYQQYDFLSNGFKNRTDLVYFNASGGTYIYAAFAENPFKYALAR